MPNYRFSEISSFEFEELCRDLLQAEFGIALELFSPGPDQGIDIRYIGVENDQNPSLVAQCKRWDESDYNGLLSHLKRIELPKIRQLAPNRYVLMTSVRLTKHRKDEILGALHPWIKSPADVYGKEDISGLLALHNEVERRHIKLWLTSTEVLDALLRSDIFNRSEDALERAKGQLRPWVPNPSFARAREVLEANRVCVISGPPGIGKSMLADVLSAGYVSQGYQLIDISDDIDEGFSAWRSNCDQVFLYDDFLGHVTSGELQLQKNEQSRLARFFERVRKNEGKRFILTTREYILAEALLRYERLTQIELENYKNIITLEDYTQKIRAQILYNHLFFSELPSQLKMALLPEQRYWEVIRHRNYNPRIIEHIVSLPGASSKTAEQFVYDCFQNLDDPKRVWGHIFRNLPIMTRHISVAVASFSSQVFLDDLRLVVERLFRRDFDSVDFQDALEMVEGTFLELKEADPGSGSRLRVAVIRDPSVLDYLWGQLQTFEGEADKLLQNAVFYEQCVILYEGVNHTAFSSTRILPRTFPSERFRDVVDPQAVADRAIELFFSEGPILVVFSEDREDRTDNIHRAPINLEQRTAFLLSVLATHPHSQAVVAAANWALKSTTEMWEEDGRSPREALYMLGEALKIETLCSSEVIWQAKLKLHKAITTNLGSADDLEALVEFAELCPDLFEDPYHNLESWSEELYEFIEDRKWWLLDQYDDPDSLEFEASTISNVASSMRVDIDDFKSDLDDHIEYLRSNEDDEEENGLPEYDEDNLEDSEDDTLVIDAMFRMLG